ncbi:hypothetical protein JXA40_12640 [bacterium]|nr:hypothetical protein [candidate division CSSED10-310 bacterium]
MSSISRPAAAVWIGCMVLACAILINAWFHFNWPVLPFDDAYITFRYAENYLEGNGLVYNKGQHVFGVSTPLFLICLILLKSVFPLNLPALAAGFSTFLFILTAVFVFLTLRRWGLPDLYSASIAAALLVHRDLVDISSGGMEPFLFTALVSAAFWAFASDRILPGTWLLGFSILTRPEGMIFIPLLGAAALIHAAACSGTHRVSSGRSILYVLSLCGPLIVWCVFSYFYYGTCIPHSLVAKSRPVYPIASGTTLKHMVYLLEDWAMNRPYAPAFRSISWAAILYVFSATIGFILTPAPFLKGFIVPAGFWSLVIIYALANPLLMPWYQPPIFLLWILTVARGIPGLAVWSADKISCRQSKKSLLKTAIRLAAMLGVVTLLSASVTRGYLKPPSGFHPAYSQDAQRLRTKSYLLAGEWLNERSSPQNSVASPEIGALGYAFKGHVYDACGLVTPEALDHLPVPVDQRLTAGLGGISTDLVFKVNPDYVVTLECFAAKSLLNSSEFRIHYALAHTIKLEKPVWYGSGKVMIFSRTD